MKELLPVLLSLLLLGTACNSPITHIFQNKKTPHEAYVMEIEESGLEKTVEGRQWLAAAENALRQAQTVSLPYKQTGYFPGDRPRALGLRFEARKGEKLTFIIGRKKANPLALYADLFSESEGLEEPVFSIDTSTTEFSYEIRKTGNYLIRLQPRLRETGNYDFSVSIGPSLAFPIKGKASIGSFWGADRDGGKRNHEGLDIFAAKGTPAIASADGVVTSVREGGLGGKQVWLHPEGSDYNLYYAHLDKQLVHTGQQVKKGDVLGLVGNTGNALTTPPHLHFGVYTVSGAVDPLPFVNPAIKTPDAIPTRKLEGHLRLTKAQKTELTTIKVNTLILPLAVMSTGYISELPDGTMIQIPFSSTQSLAKPIKKVKTKTQTPLFSSPDKEALTKYFIQPNRAISILGYFQDYIYVKQGNNEGWIQEAVLKG